MMMIRVLALTERQPENSQRNQGAIFGVAMLIKWLKSTGLIGSRGSAFGAEIKFSCSVRDS